MTTAPLHDELEYLTRRYHLYRRRYQVPAPPEIDRLERNIRRRRIQLAHLHDEISRLERHAATLAAEIAGYRKGLVALLEDFIDRTARAHGEHWSPTPVIGYRLWRVEHGMLHGAWTVWDHPAHEAVCPTPNDEDVPHLAGTCSDYGYGCGIYAAKSPHELADVHLTEDADDFVIGAVALSGKVVEHEHGYRASHARVTAVVVVSAGRRVATSDPRAVAEFFDDPLGADLDEAWEPVDGDLVAIGRWLETQGGQRWTSENDGE